MPLQRDEVTVNCPASSLMCLQSIEKSRRPHKDILGLDLMMQTMKNACRRQIDGLKDTMNASVVAGVEGAVARRIAADEGREYILQAWLLLSNTYHASIAFPCNALLCSRTASSSSLDFLLAVCL